MKSFLIRVVVGVFPLVGVIAEGEELNIARPADHPYVDPAAGREAYPSASAPVNDVRVYDFYQRQADYYMEQGETPEVIPAHPGLDAGLHGHWGKNNQNKHEDGRWNDLIRGPIKSGILRTNKMVIGKAVTVDLREGEGENRLTAAFDPLTLNYRVLWEGTGFWHPYRWGTSRNINLQGDVIFSNKGLDGWGEDTEKGDYEGFFIHERAVVFRYRFGETVVLDSPAAIAGGASGFTRTLEFPEGVDRALKTLVVTPSREFPEATLNEDGSVIFASGESNLRVATRGEGGALEVDEEGRVWLALSPMDAGGRVEVAVAAETATVEVASLFSEDETSLASLTQGGGERWPETFTLPCERGTEDGPYAIDTFALPTENPWNAVIQLSEIDFFPNGDAIVTTLQGDVWKVTGLSGDGDEATWKRFATGLHQPLGLHIDEDGIFVLGRDQITRLHDLDGNGEADFYENYANDFGNFFKSHSHTFGLGRTSDGAFHFVARDRIMRTSGGDEPKTEEIASGVRNCMGFGASRDGSDVVLIAPQEGTWTPASMIIEVNEGEFYGYLFNRSDRPEFATPLCFIPRGIDNSTGGMVHIPKAASAEHSWGPFEGDFVGLSFGACNQFLILRDAESGSRPQGAIVPLPGEFDSGVIRGAFSPQDGQLYVVGLDGWGDYALEDGCLQRVRYTGKPAYVPNGCRIHANGIRIDFPEALDPESVANVEHYFVQQWNYEYAKRYGSPEFSVRQPESLGHDPVEVKSARLLDNQKSIFLEIPDIAPVMQMHVRMHLTSASGHAFKTDLFPTIVELGDHFEGEGIEPGKLAAGTQLKMRVRESDAAVMARVTESGASGEDERDIKVTAIEGLQFNKKEIVVTAGENLALRLTNQDAMPHNLVVVKPGALEKIGTMSMMMLSDPNAGDKHYVPDEPEVVAFTHVIGPGSSHITHFQVPDEPGDYSFVCTFPGHWMTMNGVFKVMPKGADMEASEPKKKAKKTKKPKVKEDTPARAAADTATADAPKDVSLFDPSNLFGWSIMAFDAKARGPEERTKAVKELGISGYSIVPYKYRFETVFTPEELDAEITAISESGLRLYSVWADRLNVDDPLGTDLEGLHLTGLVVESLKRNQSNADVWLWLRKQDFEKHEPLTDEERAVKLAAALDIIAAEIEPLGGRVGIYNHGGWLGKAENAVKVLDVMKQKNAGVVLNLHHGSPDEAFVAETLGVAGDRLIGLVLNGHSPDGSKRGIHPFGSHDNDVGTVRAILNSGYTGPVGILDHHFESDTKVRIGQSLEGLDRILELYSNPAAKAAAE